MKCLTCGGTGTVIIDGGDTRCPSCKGGKYQRLSGKMQLSEYLKFINLYRIPKLFRHHAVRVPNEYDILSIHLEEVNEDELFLKFVIMIVFSPREYQYRKGVRFSQHKAIIKNDGYFQTYWECDYNRKNEEIRD